MRKEPTDLVGGRGAVVRRVVRVVLAAAAAFVAVQKRGACGLVLLRLANVATRLAHVAAHLQRIDRT